MQLTPREIIQKWLEYAQYDPDKKTHNLMSIQYAMHKICEKINGILEYDPNCMFATLFAKNAYMNLLREANVSMYDMLMHPEQFQKDRDMVALFHSPDVVHCEEELLSSFGLLLACVIPTKQIGERDEAGEKAALLDSIEITTKQLQECKVDLFKKGEEVLPITNFSTHIHVFNRLSECLLAVERAPDGIYLCYINEGGSVDGYFGFMIKSNGNILFVNERVDEAYPGQHKNCRSARYSEGKKYELFPYNFIFNFSDHDRLGYATKHVIDQEKLAFFNLEPEGYMPIIIAMIMLNSKYANTRLDKVRLKYIDTLLPGNLALPTPGVEALIVPSNSQIALQHKEYAVAFTSNDILRGSAHGDFDWKNRDELNPEYGCDEYGHFDTRADKEYFGFPNDSQVFIDAYGEGFELCTEKLLETNPHFKCLTSSELNETKLLPNVEFVATKRRMDLIAYQQGRKQLAEYLKDRIAEEYIAFGGKKAVLEWWDQAILDNQERIFKWCADKYNNNAASLPDGVSVYYQESTNGRPHSTYPVDFNDIWYGRCPLNKRSREGVYSCCKSGVKASQFFVLNFDHWMAIEALVGKENLPKILLGYRKSSHHVHGNDILSVTDAVTGVGTPFEYTAASSDPRLQCIEKDERGHKRNSQLEFSIIVGFSKREIKNLGKEYA